MIYMCARSAFHPYECSHDKYCEHCTLAKTNWHNPSTCALCQSLPAGHPDKATELTEPLVKEPFAVRIRVHDYSNRKQNLTVQRFLKEVTSKVPQQELPL